MYSKKVLLIFICSLFATLDIHAQHNDNYTRIGLSVQSGITFTESGSGNQFIGSNFSVPTEQTYNFGGGLHYAITPFWTVQVGYGYNKIQGVEEFEFETTIHSASLKNYFNFNRLYRRASLSEYVNPFVILGFEQDFYSFSSGQEQMSSNESAIRGGLGVSFSLSRSIELFSAYEIKLSSNRLDNVNAGFPFDQIGMLSGGIKINFGKKGSKPLRLSPAVRSLTDAEYDDFISKSNEFTETRKKVDQQQESIEKLDGDLKNANREYEAQINILDRRLEIHSERLDSLENRVDLLEDRLENQGIDIELTLRTTVESGHYVQVFATRNEANAVGVQNQMKDFLKDILPNSNSLVFVIQRNQFYEVLIGKLDLFQEANRIKDRVSELFEDSFVITFPRPLHLDEAYEGVRIYYK